MVGVVGMLGTREKTMSVALRDFGECQGELPGFWSGRMERMTHGVRQFERM